MAKLKNKSKNKDQCIFCGNNIDAPIPLSSDFIGNVNAIGGGGFNPESFVSCRKCDINYIYDSNNNRTAVVREATRFHVEYDFAAQEIFFMYEEGIIGTTNERSYSLTDNTGEILLKYFTMPKRQVNKEGRAFINKFGILM